MMDHKTPKNLNSMKKKSFKKIVWGVTPTVLHKYMVGILTQWDFHRVQEHLKQSSDEEFYGRPKLEV